MYRILFILVTLTIFTGFYTAINAQDDCIVKLNEAEKLYENGKIEKIPDLLTNCIESGFNRENKIQALRLLTLVYLFEDNTVKAEKTLLKLLKIDPEFKPNQAVDPVEFTRLINSYFTAPVFSIGIAGGINLTKPYLIEPYSLNDFKEANPVYSSGGMGFTIGLRGNYHINTQWDISFEPKYNYFTYNLVENLTETHSGQFNEKFNYLELPVYGIYHFYKINNYSFYAEAGFSYYLFLSGGFSGVVSYTDNESPDTEPPAITTSEMRKKYNASTSLGLGTKINLSRSYFSLALRYQIGLVNVVNTDVRNQNTNDITSDYLFIDNDFSINNFNIIISYNREFYIHKKKPKNGTNYDIIK